MWPDVLTADFVVTGFCPSRGAHFGNAAIRQRVGALVSRMVVVPFHPMPADVVLVHDRRDLGDVAEDLLGGHLRLSRRPGADVAGEAAVVRGGVAGWLAQRARLKQDWQKVANSVFAALAGSALVAYWALPFDVLERLGLPRFRAGIEVFFVAGMMMVLGAAWVLMSNAGLFVSPLLALFAQLPGLFYTLAKLASVYPLHRRFRTGLSLVMFSLVVFAMTSGHS